MSEAPVIERLLKRDRLITLAGLAALCFLAWLYIATGAGFGMSAWGMTAFALFPHAQPVAMPEWTAWSLAYWALMIAMWWVMMIAMMTPSAAPTILLYARVHHHAIAQDQVQNSLAPTGTFAAGYLLVWLGFSVFATMLQWFFERAGLLSAMMMGSRSRWLSAVVLVCAGIYQLSRMKNVCLSHCRTPTAFLARHWRPYRLGALRLGAMHGTYCVGCCWVLMALLFVGGVMNLAWIAALAILVLAERVLRRGQWIGRAAGIALILWGVATLAIVDST